MQSAADSGNLLFTDEYKRALEKGGPYNLSMG